jgi:hypothetical protein
MAALVMALLLSDVRLDVRVLMVFRQQKYPLQ